MLKLNKDNNELIVFSSKRHVAKIEDLYAKVRSSYINASMSVRNLEIILDKNSRNGETGKLYM